jgi:DNA-binding MarR family transcriptional regulator
VKRARRNGDRRTSMVRLTEEGSRAFAAIAAAHERWVGELLGDVSDDDTKRLSAMLKAFRSNWEGRE